MFTIGLCWLWISYRVFVDVSNMYSARCFCLQMLFSQVCHVFWLVSDGYGSYEEKLENILSAFIFFCPRCLHLDRAEECHLDYGLSNGQAETGDQSDGLSHSPK